MQPVTKDQNSTLLRWACTVGSRPGKRAKRFLLADRGLSAEQIDTWWDNAIARASQSGHNSNVSLPAHDHQSHHVHLASCQVKQADHLQPNTNPLSSEEADVLNSLPSFPRQRNHMSFSSSSTRSSQFSGSSLFARTSSLLSFPSENWDYIRSADGSSIPAHTSSGLAETDASSISYSDLLSGNYNIDTDVQSGRYIIPPDLSTNPTYPDFQHLSNEPFIEDHGSVTDDLPRYSELANLPRYSELANHESTSQYRDSVNPLSTTSTTSRVSSKTDPSQKAEKAPGKFVCTACHMRFTTKGDWKRHEGSQCEPQTYWICMRGNNPAISINGGWLCAFCDLVVPGPDRTGILSHLENVHKFNLCIRKSVDSRSFKRKDKLKHHLQKVHSLSESSSHWEKWHQGATQDKFAWGCGFCGACLFTWDGRLEHIGTHYEAHHHSISSWSHSHVIRGLLKQPHPNFNLLEAWRALVDPETDPLLEWSREDAAALKDKLEFRKGTPRGLALEARSLARPAGRNADTEMDDLAWDEDSPVVSRAMSRSVSAVGQTWPESTSLSSSSSALEPIPRMHHFQPGIGWKDEAAWSGSFGENDDHQSACDLEMREVIAKSYI